MATQAADRYQAARAALESAGSDSSLLTLVSAPMLSSTEVGRRLHVATGNTVFDTGFIRFAKTIPLDMTPFKPSMMVIRRTKDGALADLRQKMCL